ncbi:MAG: SRPBCC family protein [Betaproteobacteria bacterium]
MNPILFGGALGALAMYFLDADSGRRRRHRTRDRVVRAARRLDEAGRVTARDAVHRSRGMVAAVRHLFDHGQVSDAALVARVRAALGRAVSHPHAIAVDAVDGYVTLDGPILSHEVRGLLRTVRHVPGVRGVGDRLTVYRDPSHVSALQGGRNRTGPRFELMQDNWSPAARLVAGALGAGLLVSASRMHSGAASGLGALLGVAGGGLLARALTNRDLASLAGFGDVERGIVVQKTICIDAPVGEVFAFWSDFRNVPRFMHNVRQVEVQEDRSRWTVSGPAGVPVQWVSEVTRTEPNALIEWRSAPGSVVKHEGCVRFEEDAGATRVTVRLCYLPPGGAFGHAVAALFGADPKSELDADLLRLKSMIETGRAPHDAAQRSMAAKESY